MKKTTVLTIMLGIALGVGGFYISRREAEKTPAHVNPVIPQNIVENVQAFIMPAGQAAYIPIRNFNITEPEFESRAIILVDSASDRVLFSKNPDQKMPIASITKLMTAIVALEKMDAEAEYTVYAEDLNVDGYGADFEAGEVLRGRELLKMMLVKSSNDAASVFATNAYKKGLDFVGLMNQYAGKLGMSSTYFSDPAGLNDQDSYSTARDVVKLVRAALKYDAIRENAVIPGADVSTFGGTIYHIINTNRLLGALPDIILGKTGNTSGALGTLTLAVRVDEDDNIIAVVLGSDDRFGDMEKLIKWAKKAHQWR